MRHSLIRTLEPCNYAGGFHEAACLILNPVPDEFDWWLQMFTLAGPREYGFQPNAQETP
jgi:hypothetical protein